MKRLKLISLMASLILIAGFVFPQLTNASCVACDGVNDDGKCNRSGISSKRCILSTIEATQDCSWYWTLKEECPELDDDFLQ